MGVMSRRWRKQSLFERMGVLDAQRDGGIGLLAWAEEVISATPKGTDRWWAAVAEKEARGVQAREAVQQTVMEFAAAWWLKYGRHEFVITRQDAGALVEGYRRAFEADPDFNHYRERRFDCIGWLIRTPGSEQELINFLSRPYMNIGGQARHGEQGIYTLSLEPAGDGAVVRVDAYETAPDGFLLGCAIAYALDTDRAEVEERTYTGRGARPRVLRRKQRTTNPERIIRLKGDPPRRVFTRTVGAPTTAAQPGPSRPAVARQVPAGHQGKWVLSPRVGEEVLEIREREGKSPLHLVIRPRRAYRTSGAPPRPARLRLEGA